MLSTILLGAVSVIASMARGADARTLSIAPRTQTASAQTERQGPLILDRGEGQQEVWFPRDEELTYTVASDL